MNKMIFGMFPQTEVMDDALIAALKTAHKTSETVLRLDGKDYFALKDGGYGFFDDNYDVIAEHDGQVLNQLAILQAKKDLGCFEYAGQFFAESKGKFYRAEPIEWDVLAENDVQAFVVSSKVLFADHFDDSNYEESALRNWLNDAFIKVALSEEESKIRTVEVDNGLESTCDNMNSELCPNTFDKVFLLSAREVEEYLPDALVRRAEKTDFSSVFKEFKAPADLTSWWLRSPYDSRYDMKYVDEQGHVSHDTCLHPRGVRPACIIRL